MSGRMTKKAYQKMIDEDLEWLKKQPASLERDHIELVLRSSTKDQYPHDYDDKTEAEAAEECERLFSSFAARAAAFEEASALLLTRAGVEFVNNRDERAKWCRETAKDLAELGEANRKKQHDYADEQTKKAMGW